MKVEAEPRTFVLAALAYDPIGQLRASVANVGRQLAMSEVQSPLADPVRYVDDGYWRRTSLMRIIPDARACESKGRCASRLPARALNILQDLVIVLSVLVLVAGPVLLTLARRMGWTRVSDEEARRLGSVAGLALAYVLLNAIVCAVLSAPVPRYQARLIWLLPAIAMLIGAATIHFRRTESSGSSLEIGNTIDCNNLAPL